MLSVVITSCHDDKACYLTAFAVACQLEQLAEPHEIIIVADGGTEVKWENQGFRCLRGNFGSPQASRDAGIRVARYADVLVLESHVVVDDVPKLLLEHQYLRAALTFCSRRAEGPEMFDVYGATTDWDGSLWYKRLLYEPCSDKPYRVSQFGNSCFIVNREWYLSSGGYTNLMTGWGGEEPFLCLKAWMTGRECWLVPTVAHYHYLSPGAHGGEILGQSESYKRNFQILGYVMDGRPMPNVTPEIKAERQKMLDGRFAGSTERLRAYFQREGVVS